MTSQPDSPATDRMGIEEYPMDPQEAPLASDYRGADERPGGASSEAAGSRPAQDPDLIIVAGEVVDEHTDADTPDTETGDDLTADDLTGDDLTRDDLTRDDPDDYSASSGSELVAAEAAGATGLTGTQSGTYTADGVHSEAYPADGRSVADNALSVDLGQQWHDIQAMFVDDPRGSVELAAAAADSAVSALMETLHQRQSALTPTGTSSADPGGTEQLREALRSYRIFCQSLTEIGQRLAQPATMTQVTQ